MVVVVISSLSISIEKRNEKKGSEKIRQSWESLIWKVIGVDCQFFLENENYPMLRNIAAYSKRQLLNKSIDCLIFDGS